MIPPRSSRPTIAVPGLLCPALGRITVRLLAAVALHRALTCALRFPQCPACGTYTHPLGSACSPQSTAPPFRSVPFDYPILTFTASRRYARGPYRFGRHESCTRCDVDECSSSSAGQAGRCWRCWRRCCRWLAPCWAQHWSSRSRGSPRRQPSANDARRRRRPPCCWSWWSRRCSCRCRNRGTSRTPGWPQPRSDGCLYSGQPFR